MEGTPQKAPWYKFSVSPLFCLFFFLSSSQTTFAMKFIPTCDHLHRFFIASPAHIARRSEAKWRTSKFPHFIPLSTLADNEPTEVRGATDRFSDALARSADMAKFTITTTR